MNQKIWGLGGLLVLALAVTAVLAGASGHATGSSERRAVAPPGLVQSGPLDTEATLAYWTPERMDRARPVAAVMNVAATERTPNEVVESGPTKSGPGWAPASLQTGKVGVPESGGDDAAQPATECYHCGVPYTRYPFFPTKSYVDYPISTVAKIFFTLGGSQFVCSGSTIYTNQVWTAGHCFSGSGQFASSVLVCPQYLNGKVGKPGCWAAANLWTTSNWLYNGSFEWDMGVIVTSPTGGKKKKPIGTITGWLGYSFSGARNRHYTSLGYPQAAPFDGQTVQMCQSQYGFDDNEGNALGGPDSVAIGCDLTGGSSGGPWLAGFSPYVGASNYIVGHNDWKWTASPQWMMSPYLGSTACSLLNSAGRPCT